MIILVLLAKDIVLALIAMLAHECGHLLAARSVSVKVHGIAIRLRGICIVREAGTPAQNVFVSLAGPATNLALMVVLPHGSAFFLANFCLFVANLVPVRGSDGDRAISAFSQLRNCHRSVKVESGHSLVSAPGTSSRK